MENYNNENTREFKLNDFEQKSNIEQESLVNHSDENNHITAEKEFSNSKILDISNFKMSNDSIKFDNMINQSNEPHVNHIIAGKPLRIGTFKGLDIKKIQNTIYGENNISELEKVISILKNFFDHISNKDNLSFNDWLKTINAFDLEDIYAAIYRATIYNEDTVLVSCDGCKSDSLVVMDDDFENLYMKFKSEEDKKKYIELYNSNLTTSDKNSKIIAINDKFAVEISLPSIYDDAIIKSYIEKNYPKIKQNYSEALDYSLYIDNIYIINSENQTLTPIDMISSKIKNNNSVEDDVNKCRLRVQNINKLLSNIDVDDVNILDNAIKQLETYTKSYEYITPDTVCPKCGNIIESKYVGDLMINMVLQRINATLE